MDGHVARMGEMINPYNFLRGYRDDTVAKLKVLRLAEELSFRLVREEWSILAFVTI
jgi:hypothetical protein